MTFTLSELNKTIRVGFMLVKRNLNYSYFSSILILIIFDIHDVKIS